mgnify:CR=1 FL=1
MNVFKFYKLYICIDSDVSENIKKMYQQKAFDNNILQYSPPENSFVRADAGEMAIMSSTIVNKVYALVRLKNYENSYLFAGRSMDANVISALNDTVSVKNEYTFLENNRDLRKYENKSFTDTLQLCYVLPKTSFHLLNKKQLNDNKKIQNSK